MITLVTSLYRAEKYLPRFIRGVNRFSQQAAGRFAFEILIIANDSTPKEEKFFSILEKMKEVKIIRVSREPLYASWNRGVNNARYNVIGFWNVDDVRFAESIQAGLDKIKNGAKMIYYPFLYKRYIHLLGVDFLVKRKVIVPQDFSKIEFGRSMHCGPFFIFTKDFYNAVGPFDEQFRIVGDFEWCVRASKVADFEKVNIVAGIFHNNGTSLSGSKDERHIVENNIVYERYGVMEKMIPTNSGLKSEYQLYFK